MNKNFNRTLAAFIIGGVLLGTGASTSAYAKTLNTNTSTSVKAENLKGQRFQKMSPQNMENNYKTTLDSLVKAGTITQEQEDKILDYIKTKDDARKAEIEKIKSMTEADRKAYFESMSKTQKSDIFAELVSSNIISQTQADAIKKAMPQKNNFKGIMNPGDIQKNMSTKLDSLVKAGTITQAQEDSIVAAYKQQQDNMKAEMEKIKSMSEADRKAYLETNKKTIKTDVLASLVSAGTITQAQADAVKNAVMPQQRGFKISMNSEGIKTRLDSAVKAGTITQAQEDSIVAAYKQQQDNMKAEMEKVKSMSQTERKAYFEANKKTEKTDVLADLVKAGTITQAQADSLKSLIFRQPQGHGNRMLKDNLGTTQSSNQ